MQADVFGYENTLAPHSVDVIVSNPPYVTAQEYEALAPELRFEPREALVAPQQGLCFYRHIAPAYFPALKSGGALVFEIGAGQAQQVAAFCRAAGYAGISVRRDAAGLPRCVYAEKP